MLQQRKWLGLAMASVVIVGIMPGFSSGPFSGLSGAPGDGDCTQCHGSFPLNSGVAAGIATFDVTPTPETTVSGNPITLDVGFPTTTRMRHGFEATVRDSTGTTGTAGFTGNFTLTDPANTTFALFGSDPTYVTHNSSGSFQSSWSVDWAPDASTPSGPITVYAAGNAANGNGSSSGDYIFTTSAKIYQAEVIANQAVSPSTVHPITLSAPNQSFAGYVLVLSEDPTDTPLSPTLSLAVNPFSIFGQLSLAPPMPGVPSLFNDFVGVLDGTGTGNASVVVPPYDPAIAGASLYLGFVTFDQAQLPNFVPTEVSNELELVLQ